MHDNVKWHDGEHSGCSCAQTRSGGRRGGMPKGQGSKVAMCEKYLMMQASVAYIVRTGQLSSRGTTVRTSRKDSLSGSDCGVRCYNLIDRWPIWSRLGC